MLPTPLSPSLRHLVSIFLTENAYDFLGTFLPRRFNSASLISYSISLISNSILSNGVAFLHQVRYFCSALLNIRRADPDIALPFVGYTATILTVSVTIKGHDVICFTFDANAPNVVAFALRWHNMSAPPKIQTKQARRVGRLACTMLDTCQNEPELQKSKWKRFASRYARAKA